jgi:hypothetical protein
MADYHNWITYNENIFMWLMALEAEMLKMERSYFMRASCCAIPQQRWQGKRNRELNSLLQEAHCFSN